MDAKVFALAIPMEVFVICNNGNFRDLKQIITNDRVPFQDIIKLVNKKVKFKDDPKKMRDFVLFTARMAQLYKSLDGGRMSYFLFFLRLVQMNEMVLTPVIEIAKKKKKTKNGFLFLPRTQVELYSLLECTSELLLPKVIIDVDVPIVVKKEK